MSRPWLTVGVPTRDRPEALGGLLVLLAAQAPALRERWQVEVLVADGSAEPAPLPAALDRAVDEARVLPVEGGVSAGRNRLAAAARGEVLVLVDDDVRPHPGALATLADAAAPGVAAVGRVDGLGHRPGTASELMVVGRGGYGEPAAGRTPDYAVSALMALARDVYTGVRWDERFAAPHLDDVAYGLRLREAGVHLVLCPQATADHPPRRFGEKDRPELAGLRALVVLRCYRRRPVGPWLRCLGHQVWAQRRSARGLGVAVTRYTAATLQERSAR